MKFNKELLNDGSNVRFGLEMTDEFIKGTVSSILQDKVPKRENFNPLKSPSESLIIQPDALRVEKNIFKEWKYEKND